jgi:hypothetical protein
MKRMSVRKYELHIPWSNNLSLEIYYSANPNTVNSQLSRLMKERRCMNN